MTPNKTIYLIHQSPELRKTWRELSVAQRRAVLAKCETQEESEIERIVEEIAIGQRRLF